MTARLSLHPALMWGQEVHLHGKVIGTVSQAADTTYRFFLADTPEAQSLPHPFPHFLKSESPEAVLRFLEATLDFIEEESR